MIRAAALAGLVPLLLTGQGSARDLILNPPMACDLTGPCFIQQYMDRDEGPGAADFTCNLLSNNDHSGTDFALPSLAMMAAGVAVVAAAPGSVKGARDGMADVDQSAAGAPDVSGKECGNGVLVDHGGGWETQYCHMKQGSVAVEIGDRVRTGTVLGQVGMSGAAQFPHLHLSVRHDGQNIDPFHPDPTITCGEPAPLQLWQEPIAYRPGGLINAGFSADIPTFDAVKSGLLDTPALPTASPALVVWAHLFGSRAGDVVEISITGPEGAILDQKIPLDKPQARLFRAAGKRAPANGWPAGRYQGTARLLRGGEVIDQQAVDVILTP